MPQTDSGDLSRRLRSRALALGAERAGFAPAALPSVPNGGADAYRDWVSRGMHGEMGYMARNPEDRCDIRRWFPGAKSVVLCAFSYHDGSPPPEHDPARGRFARYSLPPDYHDELKNRMKRLQSEYVEISGGQSKLFVDTSPVLERLYARYAGIGWVGKNTMILSKDIGSFFLLAGLAVDRELEYDEPVDPHCGTCTRCLDACPTDAFPKPNVLDATKCVANFTVEQRKSPIPEKYRSGHGNWVFGCDVCQDVCPWNKFSVRSALFSPVRPATEDLEESLRLTPAQFRAKYKNSSLERTGHKAFLRNVLLAMGNSRNPAYTKSVRAFIDHENEMVAEQARWSFARLNCA